MPVMLCVILTRPQSTSAPKTASKRVFLITDDDNPNPGSTKLLTSARTTLIVNDGYYDKRLVADGTTGPHTVRVSN